MSALGNAVDFLVDLGFFDVILPFLLVFTIVFGVLEKTKIFGTEKVGGEEYPKRNLNAMIAFVIAFFTLAAKNIVEMLQVSLPLVALVLTILICFMLLVGSFYKEGEFELGNKWIKYLSVLVFVAVLGIFFYAFGWLEVIFEYLSRPTSQQYILPGVLIIGIGLLIGWLIGSPSPSSNSGGPSNGA